MELAVHIVVILQSNHAGFAACSRRAFGIEKVFRQSFSLYRDGIVTSLSSQAMESEANSNVPWTMMDFDASRPLNLGAKIFEHSLDQRGIATT